MLDEIGFTFWLFISFSDANYMKDAIGNKDNFETAMFFVLTVFSVYFAVEHVRRIK